MAVVLSARELAAGPLSGSTDSPDTLPPSFWPTHPSNLGGKAPLDLMCPSNVGAGDKASPFYHYPDAVFSDAISTQTREWLRACWTDLDKVKEFLGSGAVDIHQANANGFTGLHMAASKFKLDIAEYLVEMGHDVNIEEQNGQTPLDYCVDSGAKEQGVNGLPQVGNKGYLAMVEFLESRGGVRKEERSWLCAANQEKHAPNMPN
mmetsp:Transcript_34053/g.90276  ORF Transcript_34053/g.90276 Transcript_34053/m.90276 type:complete len:205 (-) Transcript_34053:219-833(-)